MQTLKFREFINGKFHYWGFVEEGIFKGPATPSKFHMEKVTPESDAVHTEKYCKVLSGLTKKIMK